MLSMHIINYVWETKENQEPSREKESLWLGLSSMQWSEDQKHEGLHRTEQGRLRRRWWEYGQSLGGSESHCHGVVCQGDKDFQRLHTTKVLGIMGEILLTPAEDSMASASSCTQILAVIAVG